MGNNVLVTDDNAANIFAVSTMLRQMGFEVDEASSGVEAINLSCHKNYRLILMDYLMPEMDGIQAIQQIQFIMRGEDCPVFIGLSATLDEDVTSIFRNVGVEYLLEKPVRMGKLQKILDEIGISVAGDDGGEQVDRTDLQSLFSGIDELDYEKGIDLMAGSLDNYMNVLKVCVKNIADNYTALNDIRDTYQPENFALHFHSLKGVFLNIGADGLVDESRELETAAKQHRPDEVVRHLESYMKRIKALAEKIEHVCDKYDAGRHEDAASADVSDAEFAAQLSELKQHIEDFEYIEITGLLNQMLSGCRGERRESLEKIAGAIEDFDYDSALEKLEHYSEQ